jgi:hypothetical protein
MSDMPETPADPISSPVGEVLATFRDTLADVRFPEVDRVALEALAEDVRAHAAAATLARVTLAGALVALEEAQGRLARRAELALAYARVYAESAEDPALSERLAAIPLGRAQRIERRVPAPAAPRRTRKQSAAQLAESADGAVPQLALDDAAAE